MVRIGAEEKLFLRLKKSFTQTGFEAFRGNLGRKVIGGRGVNFEGIFRFYGILKSLKSIFGVNIYWTNVSLYAS